MKKTIVLTLLTGLALGTTALAQGAGRGHHFGHMFGRLDQDGDGKITQAEMTSVVQTRFAEFDLNKDGKISQDEAKQAAEAKRDQHRERSEERLKSADKNGDGKWTKDELARMPERRFSKLDGNGDGTVTREELQAGRERFDSHRGGFIAHIWERLDTNSDGVIDNGEALKLAQTRFEKSDANHDGVVEKQEWKAGHKRHGGKHDCDKGSKDTQPSQAAGDHT